MPTVDLAAEPTLLEPRNAVVAGSASVGGLLLMLGGAGAAVFCVVSAFRVHMDSTGDWVLLAGCFLVTLLVAVLGRRIFASFRADRAATIALAEHGVDAEALVLSAVLLPDSATEDLLDVRVRVFGAGFEEFEATEKLTADRFEGVVEGAVLAARVNPSSLVFSLHRLGAVRQRT
ncbi:hypothetical protein V2S66_28530 [Streptomyces sp. V4-01]|uniref:Uncharacterized protein n=1 Tax=Actinacidiphila polyblastidii TaxID=3110430 RepID=A0ABU7PJA4_9ACTN|nr:hypothetical protein [Streptomyces sp. V4-01]